LKDGFVAKNASRHDEIYPTRKALPQWIYSSKQPDV